MDAAQPLTTSSDRPQTRPLPQLSGGRAAAVFVGIGLVMTLVLLAGGRRWWCAFGDLSPWTLDAWGPHNSQHLIDAYVFSHLLHGVILYFVFHVGGLRRFPAWQLFGVLLLEAAWEVFENSPFVIERYRTTTNASAYTGDSVLNSITDYAACLIGWLLSRQLGWKWAVAIFFAAETGCLLWIRDNLTLNVLMIFHPVEAIQRWQSGAGA
ncbi:MAG TPA: DUF2585 family protein [Tepidisphaeraceae bacterium]